MPGSGNTSFQPDNVASQYRSQLVDRLRNEDQPTVPTTLAMKLDANPLLRVRSPDVVMATENFHGCDPQSYADVFSALRDWKNVF